MKTWQCPFSGAYVKIGEKCPECHLTQEEAREYAIEMSEEDEEYYDELEQMYEEAVTDFNNGTF